MWKNLAPQLVRQRVIIEGTTEKIVEPEQIKAYLLAIAEVTKMEVLSGPYAYSAHELGYGGWVHWRTSGCHFYSYPAGGSWAIEKPFFSVDCYTCKPFDPVALVEFTKKYLNVIEIVWKEIEV